MISEAEPEVEVQTPKTVDPTALVRIEDGGTWTTSLAVAQAFDKRHGDVMRTVDRLGCSTAFHRRNFASVDIPYQNASGERKQRAYRFTRDGFCMVVFGFTGEKAVAWKERFLAAFNAMEAELRSIDNLECSTEFHRLNFEQVEIPYRNASGEHKRRIDRFTRGRCRIGLGAPVAPRRRREREASADRSS